MITKPYRVVRKPDATVTLAPIPRLTLSLAEAADAIGVCESTMRELARSGAVPTCPIGTKRIVVRVSALEAYLAEQEARRMAEIRAEQEAAMARIRKPEHGGRRSRAAT